ncbi:MAG: hypothetical protein BMS9Abin29_2375 [Gemmatimonadota bacterium]|nr:MAG: hypothetical protein BMS9Abin29_2375 [Gemmatimonadota bacterium]
MRIETFSGDGSLRRRLGYVSVAIPSAPSLALNLNALRW